MIKSDSLTSKLLAFAKGVVMWIGGLTLWFLYAYNTLDRSEIAYQATDGSGPMPSGYSVLLLAVLLAILLGRDVFSKQKSFKSLATKLLVLLIAVFGLWIQLSYDPSLTKLKEYRNSSTKEEALSKHSFTGQEFFDAVNEYRASKGLNKLELYQPLCNGLIERWQVLKDPDTFGHQGLEEWLNKIDPDVKLDVSEVSSSGGDSDTLGNVMSGLISSPGHRLAMEDPNATLGCAYAAQGTGVVEIAHRR